MIKVLDLRHKEAAINEKRIIRIEPYKTLNLIYFDNDKTFETYSTIDQIIRATRDEEVKQNLERKMKMSLKELHKEERGK